MVHEHPSARALSLYFVVLLAVALPSAAQAELDVRVGGRPWASIEDDGTVRIQGSSVGRIEPSGFVSRDGRRIGELEDDGTLRRDGRMIALREERQERPNSPLRAEVSAAVPDAAPRPPIEPDGSLVLDSTHGTPVSANGAVPLDPAVLKSAAGMPPGAAKQIMMASTVVTWSSVETAGNRRPAEGIPLAAGTAPRDRTAEMARITPPLLTSQ